MTTRLIYPEREVRPISMSAALNGEVGLAGARWMPLLVTFAGPTPNTVDHALMLLEVAGRKKASLASAS